MYTSSRYQRNVHYKYQSGIDNRKGNRYGFGAVYTAKSEMQTHKIIYFWSAFYRIYDIKFAE